MIERWGAVVVRRAVVVLLVGIGITAAAMFAGVGLEDKLSSGGFDDPSSQSAQELTQERATFGNNSIDVIAIFTDPDGKVTDEAFETEVEKTLAAVPSDRVSAVASYYSTQDPSMISHDEHATAVYISLAGDTQNEFMDSYRAIRPTLQDSGLDVDLAGPFAVYSDVNDHTKDDLAMAELISAPIVLLLSLIIFRSVTASLLPLLVGLVTVLGARAAIAGLNEVTEVSIFAPNIITLIGLGLSIDYALFMVSRFREEIALTPDDTSRALIRTMSTAGRTVTFSALTVAASMSSLLVFPQAFLKSIGYGGIAAVLVAMVAALTVLPAAMALLGKRVDSLRIPFLQRGSTVDNDHGAWSRLAKGVMRRPVLVAAGVVVVLLAVAAPFLGVKWGSVDYRVLPEDASAHQAAARLNTEFGPERSTANVLIEDADQAEVTTYMDDLRQVEGVVDVRPVKTEGDTTLLRAAWEGNSQGEHSQDVVRGLRDVDSPDGTTALVGGLTADTVDLASSVKSHLPWMGLIVVGVMLLLLFIAFGSVVLPIKAVVMNFFSITASFGVVTWIFSDGHLSNLLGFTSSGFLDLTNPIVMLAVLFGLSMDYEVFLLSRVREQWDLTHDNDQAVATGLQKTGRIITSAALLLAVVIGAFAMSGVVFMKMMGIGMLVALLVDATIVRALLVPATMKLLGKWNWWAPAPMARWWDRHGFREEGRPPGDDADEKAPLRAQV
ncbi:MMPL family transporter [Nocardioides humilatus]|uniref:MMPL family transporter n=1 Tax=Nocardioides humilatus TaxID=2607660 RepID=A0A5B1LQ77_9ACTN|nr:MMPL family transporter [Nocardioides humilatus]KAA1421757.1 MMPL family transporter [Nocardioides humilatus]